jgi:hypothetical protein
MSSYNRILGYDRVTGSWNNVACNSTGALYVTGLSGGTSGGDASASNQLTQIANGLAANVAIFNQLATQTDRMLFDLDIIANRLHDIEGTVTVDNQISGFATENKQDSLITTVQNSNSAQYVQLSLIAEAGEISSEYLQSITAKLSGVPRGTASYTLDAKTTLAPDTVPAYSQPPSGIEPSQGWYYKNTSAGNTSQLYYYANLASQTKNYDYQIGAVQSQYAIVRILNLTSGVGLPFLVVYSQPTGSGDIIPGFARSSWVYQIKSTEQLRLGEQIMIYRGVAPDSRIYPDVRRVECSLTVTRGPALDTEILAYATLNSDSGAPINSCEYIVGGAGLAFIGDHIYDVQLTAESPSVSVGDASASNQLTQITRAEQSNTAVCVRLDKNTYTGSNLHVRDDLLKTSMESQFTNINSTLGQGLYINMETDPAISGGVKLRGLTDGNLFVYDTRAETKLIDCFDELITLNGTISDLTDGTKQMYCALSGADDSVSVMGYNATLMMPETITLSTSSGIRALDVHVANQPSGYATSSGQDDLIELIQAQSLSDRFQVEDPQGNTKLDTIITNMSLTNFNVNNLTKCDTDSVVIPAGVAINGTVFVDGLTTCNTNDVYISNYPTTQSVSLGGETVSVSGTFWQETQPVSIASPVDSNITNTSIDVHGYASSDGTNWHHLKSDATGHLIVHSETRDGNNNRITSTNMTGTEIWRGLDVAVKNAVSITGAVSVQNATETTLQIGKPNAVVSTLYTGAISGSFLGNADMDGYSSFDLLVTIPAGAASVAGQLYICISDNGSDWYFTNFSVTISIDAVNVRRYTTSVTSLNSRYVCVTGANPFGTPLSTTNSTIKISAKK